MSEWWTYSLSDFLLFSPRTYYRLIELYNHAIWPAQLAGLAAGGAVVASMMGWRGGSTRLAGSLLAACWLWIAWAFHDQRYTQINWAATWFAAAFAVEAMLLALAAVIGGRFAAPSSRSAAWVVAIVILGYPSLALVSGRTWTTAEVFGIAPDPTAVATVAAVGLFHGRVRCILWVVPLVWCAIAAATLWAMNEVASAAILVVLAIVAVSATRCSSRDRSNRW